MLPKIDRTWKFDHALPKLQIPDEHASYSPLTAYILRKLFTDTSLFKARTFKDMCKILDAKFPAVGEVPEIPYISRATIAYVHSLILHSPYYNRDDKKIKGKIKNYYMREFESMEDISDEDFNCGLHDMFKDHFIWIAKDVSAGYTPEMDMYAVPPREATSREPTPPPPADPHADPPAPPAGARPGPGVPEPVPEPAEAAGAGAGDDTQGDIEALSPRGSGNGFAAASPQP